MKTIEEIPDLTEPWPRKSLPIEKPKVRPFIKWGLTVSILLNVLALIGGCHAFKARGDVVISIQAQFLPLVSEEVTTVPLFDTVTNCDDTGTNCWITPGTNQIDTLTITNCYAMAVSRLTATNFVDLSLFDTSTCDMETITNCTIALLSWESDSGVFDLQWSCDLAAWNSFNLLWHGGGSYIDPVASLSRFYRLARMDGAQ